MILLRYTILSLPVYTVVSSEQYCDSVYLLSAYPDDGTQRDEMRWTTETHQHHWS